MHHIEGGSVLPITDFWVGSGAHSHTSEQPGRPVSLDDLRATNTLQRTGWRINRGVLETAQRALSAGHPVLEVDPRWPPPRPVRIRSDEWASLPSDARLRHIEAARAARTERTAWASTVSALTSLLRAADADRDHPSLWIPYGHDARLRRYPLVSSGPSPQGSGLSRSILMFDQGVPLGSRGLYWLAVRAATCAGLDKLDHDARAEWASQHTEEIRATARDPFATSWWWEGRDDPWGLLATAFELHEALAEPSPGDFHSHLPVQVDGTCNGLQHLSAMGLDPRGAYATNLTDSRERQDIYELVARRVRSRVTDDVERGLEVSLVWGGEAVTRDTVKRGVMTTPYGVTARGLRDQLLDDDLVPETDDAGAAADYLRDVMWESIGHVVVAARNLMDWLQTTAATLATHNVPFRWTTPTGSSLQQSYRPVVVIRPLTKFGRVYLGSSVDRSSLKVRKQALGASPNYVHSFDAAHMAMTINAGADRGITHWSTIHDSYGTHAARMDTLNRTLREEFVRIYETDWLRHTWEMTREYAPRVEIAPPPVRGDFDVSQVLKSPWFFA